MFGYIQANLKDLSEEEKNRYKAAYCGLCHALGERYGGTAKLGLSYDLTFIALLLSSLYEPEEKTGRKRCMIHPAKRHDYMINKYTEYAADMSVVLNYHNCLDDWNDDKKLTKKCYANALEPKYKEAKKRWPDECRQIEEAIKSLGEIENKKVSNPDEAANCSGRLLAATLSPFKDNWQPYLRKIGFGLGKFIYLADAACDYYDDIKKKSYNPLVLCGIKPEEMKPILMQILGEVSESFEKLPLIQDEHILKNILYSGIWQKYNYEMQKQSKKGAAK